MKSFQSSNLTDVASDLDVALTATCLAGKRIDLIVTGSIAAVESVRLIRALRRLGATVQPWLSPGAEQFITPLAVEWAADQPAVTRFSGRQSHVATGDACLVMPMSANFQAGLVAGEAHHPALALALSYSGTDRPRIAVTTMHSSMATALATQDNQFRLQDMGWQLLAPRLEEGKHKIPDPDTLADMVSHRINHRRDRVVLTMGGNHNPIDSVRGVANYSSGGLGTAICQELYRRGWQVDVICGTAQVKPKLYQKLSDAPSFPEMAQAIAAAKSESYQSVIFAAAVADYLPVIDSQQAVSGKVRSGANDLSITMEPTAKLISQIAPVPGGTKVGFKLEPGLVSETQAQQLARDYCQRYGLTLLVVNGKDDVSPTQHAAHLVHPDESSQQLQGKLAIAQGICDHVEDQSANQT